MTILTKDKCPECDGAGLLTNNYWSIFYPQDEAYKKEHGEYMSEDQTKLFFMEKFGCYKLPPEEEQCGECEGKGTVENWLSIEDLQKALYSLQAKTKTP